MSTNSEDGGLSSTRGGGGQRGGVSPPDNSWQRGQRELTRRVAPRAHVPEASEPALAALVGGLGGGRGVSSGSPLPAHALPQRVRVVVNQDPCVEADVDPHGTGAPCAESWAAPCVFACLRVCVFACVKCTLC